MIRPRVGDFVYSTHEFETMLEDVSAFRALGVRGVVIGMLCSDGSVDCDRRVVVIGIPRSDGSVDHAE